MKIIREEKEDITVFHISGFMTGDTIELFRQSFENTLNAGKNRIVLNMENVKMIDSSGIGAIVFMVKRCRPLGDVKITGVQGHAEKIFCMLKLYKIIDMYSSVNEAVTAFRKTESRTKQKKITEWWKNFFDAVSKKIGSVVYRDIGGNVF